VTLEALDSYAEGMYESAKTGDSEFARFQDNPHAFVHKVLGIQWWAGQHAIGKAVQNSTLIAIKGANGTGKTQTMGSIVAWFKSAFRPSTVITTAPSEDQVKRQIWDELRKQVETANKNGACIDVSGMKPSECEWRMAAKDAARGIATNHPERFKGDHNPHMLVVIDEAPGTADWVLEGAFQMCSAKHNIIVLVGNPVKPSGFFHEAFAPKSPWTKITLSALDHPNVTTGKEFIPGAVSKEAVERDIKLHCVLLDSGQERDQYDFEYPRNSGIWYRPDNIFMCRVMGEFPRESEDTLIPMYQIEHAKNNRIPIDTNIPVDIGVDVAYKGGDHTVIWARRGCCVIERLRWRGHDPEESSRKIAGLCKTYVQNGCPVGTIAVDAIGMGAGIAARLDHMRDEGEIHCDRVLAVQVSEKGKNREQYSTIRAELAFALAERFKEQQIDLSRVTDRINEFETDAGAIEKGFDSRMKLTYSSKEDIRKKIGRSPDDFDAMCLCFIDTTDTFAADFASLLSAN
jgi:hypothetical protein